MCCQIPFLSALTANEFVCIRKVLKELMGPGWPVLRKLLMLFCCKHDGKGKCSEGHPFCPQFALLVWIVIHLFTCLILNANQVGGCTCIYILNPQTRTYREARPQLFPVNDHQHHTSVRHQEKTYWCHLVKKKTNKKNLILRSDIRSAKGKPVKPRQ